MRKTRTKNSVFSPYIYEVNCVKMRNTLENLDTTSVKGYGITLLSGILSMANVETWMKLIALAVTIVAGISTICYNYVKIKKSKSEP